jgi:hypothetical protein
MVRSNNVPPDCFILITTTNKKFCGAFSIVQIRLPFETLLVPRLLVIDMAMAVRHHHISLAA